MLELLTKAVGDAAIGMDCSIIPTRYPEIFQISTTDFFFPLVEDPYLQGKIACANVLSDLYACGVYNCDNVLMLMGVCDQMSNEERDIVTSQMMKGFTDLTKEAQSRVTGGQTVINAWPLIGGVAMAVVKEIDFIRPEHAVAGDFIVLTKPIGTQVSVNVNQWIDPNYRSHSKYWPLIQDVITKEKAIEAYRKSCVSMSRLNRTGAMLMHKYHAHAATDVTGFGLLGHAKNLALNQKKEVDFVIKVLPIIEKMKEVDEAVKNMFNLMKGRSAETSGGLLICLPSEESAKQFCEEIEKIDGHPAWIIGNVIERTGKENDAIIVDSPQVIST